MAVWDAPVIPVISYRERLSFWTWPIVATDVSDEERDADGKWTSGGGSSGTGPAGGGHSAKPPPREGMHHFDEKERAELKERKIVLPPAWTDVQVTDDPTSALQAIGKDAKGRSQYVYSSEHTSNQAAAKFERIKAFHDQIHKLDRTLTHDAKTDDTAASVLLMRKLGMRPGSESDTKAEKQARGATNLRASDVKVSPSGRMKLDFTGKDGVHIVLPVSDSHVKEVINSRLEGKSTTDRLFKTNEGRAADYLKSKTQGFKLKDMRTYHANHSAHQVIDKMTPPKNKAEYKKARNAVGDAVAAKLGNTRTMALNSYINPACFAKWEEAVGV